LQAILSKTYNWIDSSLIAERFQFMSESNAPLKIKKQTDRLGNFTPIHHAYLKPFKGNLEKILIFQYISSWCETNQKNRDAIKDGFAWIYHTKQEFFNELYPVFSMRTLERTLAELIEEGWLIKGCFNSDSMDRTSWYRPNWEKVKQTAIDYLNEADNSEVTVRQNGGMQPAKMAECITADLAECITPILAECSNSINKNKKNKNNKKKETSTSSPVRDVASACVEVDDTLEPIVRDWLKRTAIKAPHVKTNYVKMYEEARSILQYLGREPFILQQVLKFVDEDPFWGRNVLSLMGLLKKMPNELRKIDNVINAMNTPKISPYRHSSKKDHSKNTDADYDYERNF
jgi:hypothetical protein